VPTPPDEVVAAYVARKTAKGTYGKPKTYREPWKGRVLITGICPCPDCGHEGQPCIVCDADWQDCKCCNEVCS